MNETLRELPTYMPTALREAARSRRLAKGECLFKQGDPVDGIYFVQRGRVQAVRTLYNDTYAVMLTAAAGELFAESALAVPSYVCDAFATVASEVLRLPAEDVLAALDADGAFARAFALAMASNARRQCSRYERLRLRRARDRVLHLIVCEGGMDACFRLDKPLAELADELALEPETLYRVLRELSDAGTIERTPSHLRLLAQAEKPGIIS
jgi:CRP/FNR family transcriptional activator FtrB